MSARRRTMGCTLTSNEAAYRAAGVKMKADALHYGVVLVNVDAVLTRIRRALQAEAKEDA